MTFSTSVHVDRIGKGIRGAPRDALIGDITPVELRGTALGCAKLWIRLARSSASLLAMLLMAASSDNFRLVFWVAVFPAIVSVLLILYGVQEPDTPPRTERRPFPIRRSELRRLAFAYWVLVGIATILTLGRFSEAFLLLAAEHVGLAVALIPGVRSKREQGPCESCNPVAEQNKELSFAHPIANRT